MVSHTPDTTCLFATREKVTAYNRSSLMKSEKQDYIINAIHSESASSGSSDKNFEGLLSLLEIGIYLPIVLSMNLAVEVGLASCNLWIIWQVINFVNHGIEQPSNEYIKYHHPDLILVEFHKYPGHVFFPGNPTLVPITRSTVNKYGYSRSQFPLFGSSVLTIHKSQALTF